jgi:predicted XRE-type DNA-binding protein
LELSKNEKGTLLRWYNKIRAINYLGSKCVGCGNSDVRHLSFHHTDPNEKEIQISFILTHKWSKVESELKKCILYCHNCHLEYHFNQESENIECRVSKKIFLEYKGGECKGCGYNKCQAALTFHHLDKNTKSFQLSSNTKIFRSINQISKEIVNELDKCDLLCANCHISLGIREDILEYVISNYDKINIRKKSQKIDRVIVEEMYFHKKMKQSEITKELGVSKSTISMIISDMKNKKI